MYWRYGQEPCRVRQHNPDYEEGTMKLRVFKMLAVFAALAVLGAGRHRLWR